MSSKAERKRSLSTAFEHPTTPTRSPKTTKITTPASNTKENDPQGHNVEMPSLAKVCQPQKRQPTTPSSSTRGVPLQQLVESTLSRGAFRAKITLCDDVMESEEGEGQWEEAPFVIWEDVDVVAERMSLNEEMEE